MYVCVCVCPYESAEYYFINVYVEIGLFHLKLCGFCVNVGVVE